MESDLKSRLRQQIPQLTEALAAVNVHRMALQMWSAGYLNQTEYQSIKSCADDFKAATKLLEMTFQRGNTSIKGFAEALRSIEMPNLADQLYSEASLHHQEYFSFGEPSVNIQLSFVCHGVALTKDRCLLLAAGEHGMIELCSDTGVELSRWRPPKSSFFFVPYKDEVRGVAALSDGRTAVSLSQLVVLLKRCENGNGDQATAAGASSWTEDHRIDLLVSYPSCLSAHGDMLVVVGGWRDNRMQLMSSSTGRWLSAELQRPYDILSVAIAAKVIVTVSRSAAATGFFINNKVLDAHSVADGDERLWRREIGNFSPQHGICTDSTGGCLYVATCDLGFLTSGTRGRVSILSLADGRELQRVALSFGSDPPGPLVPEWLALEDCGTVEQPQANSMASLRVREALLAVTSYNPTIANYRHKCGTTVTVHRSNRCVNQVLH